MKYIRLEYHQDISISNEAFAQISAIVATGKICCRCEHHFTAENPEVVRNTCAKCLIQQLRHQRKLTFIGQMEEGGTYGTAYKFLSQEGSIYLSNSSSEAQDVFLSDYQTAKHYGFPVPERYSVNGKDRQLYTSQWHLYGDVKILLVVVLAYRQSHGDHLKVTFLSYKGWGCVELNKRKSAIQALFRQARQKADRTKDTFGEYHLHSDHPEWTTSILEDSSLYPLIAQIASEDYLKSLPKETHESKA